MNYELRMPTKAIESRFKKVENKIFAKHAIATKIQFFNGIVHTKCIFCIAMLLKIDLVTKQHEIKRYFN